MNDVSCSLVPSSFVDAHAPHSPFALQYLSGQREKITLLLKISKSIGHNAKAPARTECAAQISLDIFHKEHMH